MRFNLQLLARVCPGMLLTLLFVVAAGCATSHAPTPPMLLGEVDRARVEAAVPSWRQEQISAEAVEALTQVEPGAEVAVYLGTWCSDSRRELKRFWRALDEAGMTEADLPFSIDYTAVDRYEQREPRFEEELGLRWVPTLIVYRDGEEVGRIVEHAEDGIESDLLALLTGDRSGWISASQTP